MGAHTRAFAAIGGVPKLLVSDNTKVAVIKACLHEPQVNRTWAEMAAHYDTAILPARPRRPVCAAAHGAAGVLSVAPEAARRLHALTLG
jgi:transposase